jgi:WD40 repeat protein
VARLGSTRFRHRDTTCPYAFAPDGRTLFVGTWYHDAFYAWDAATGRLRWRNTFATRTWQDHTAVRQTDPRDIGFVGPDPVVLQPDGDGRECVVRFDAATGKEVSRVRLDPRPASGDYRFSRDGARVAVACDHNLAVYDTATGRRVFARRGDYDVRDVAFSPDGRSLATLDRKGVIHLLRAASGEPVRDVPVRDVSPALVGFALGGAALVVRPRGGFLAPVLVIDAATGAVRHRLQTTGDDGWRVDGAAVTPDGKSVVVAGRIYATAGGLGEFVTVWDAETGKEVRRFPCRLTFRLAVRPDGGVLAAGDGYTTELFDLPTGKLLPQSADPPGGYTDLRPAPDGEWVGLSEWAGPAGWGGVDRFDRTGRRLSRFVPPITPDEQWWGYLSPDGSRMARVRTTRADEKSNPVEVWDTKAEKLLVSFGREPGTERVERFSRGGLSVRGFSPDGRIVFTGAGRTSGGPVAAWDATTGKPAALPAGWKPKDYRVDQSPDGRWVAKYRQKANRSPRPGFQRVPQEVVITEAATGREAGVLHDTDADGFGVIAFSPDGRRLAAAAYHDTAIINGRPPASDVLVYLFEVPSGREVGRIRGTDGGVEKLAFSPDGRTLATAGYGRVARLYEVATLGERQSVPHGRLLYTLAFAANGRTLAATGEDAPAYLWDVRGVLDKQAAPPTPAALTEAWAGLASPDAKTGFAAIKRLTNSPAEAVPFLRKNLSPAAAPGPAGGAAPTPEDLRAVRAVEAAEWMGTPEAVRLLEGWAGGAGEARLTTEAKAAVGRVQKAGRQGGGRR